MSTSRFRRVVLKLSGEAFADRTIGFGIDPEGVQRIAAEVTRARADLGVEIAIGYRRIEEEQLAAPGKRRNDRGVLRRTVEVGEHIQAQLGRAVGVGSEEEAVLHRQAEAEVVGPLNLEREAAIDRQGITVIGHAGVVVHATVVRADRAARVLTIRHLQSKGVQTLVSNCSRICSRRDLCQYRNPTA